VVASHLGWKLQYQNATPKATLEHEDEIFYGLGNCPYMPTSPSQLNQSVTKEEIVDFYVRLMRTDCLSGKRIYILSLLQEGYLVLDSRLLRVQRHLQFL